MKRVSLGRTGFPVGVIGFGGIPIQRLQETDGVALIKEAAAQGINFIDSARGYGTSEAIIGKGIQGNREHWVLATKSTAKDYETMKQDVEISLKNLQTDVIDLYQFHLVRSKEQYDTIMGENGAYRALLEAKEAGKIRAIGITSHTLSVLEMAVETDYFDTIQFPYNAVERQAEGVFQRARERSIGVIVMKPLAGGALTVGNLALRFILENPNVSVVIPGMDHLDQVAENARIAAAEPLTLQERQALKEITDQLGMTFCRRCGYCLPCPQEIDIPTQFLIDGYFTRYNLQGWAKERYAALPKKASDCVQCGACEKRCPYDLPIRTMLQGVTANLG